MTVLLKQNTGGLMKAVVTVTGKDGVGIIAKVATACASCDANILEISQSVLREYFAMIMLVDIEKLNVDFSIFSDRLTNLGKEHGLDIHAMHEDIFQAMHHV
jgi:ACT domain-containing protein